MCVRSPNFALHATGYEIMEQEGEVLDFSERKQAALDLCSSTLQKCSALDLGEEIMG